MLDLMILEVFSNLDDSMILQKLWPVTSSVNTVLWGNKEAGEQLQLAGGGGKG